MTVSRRAYKQANTPVSRHTQLQGRARHRGLHLSACLSIACVTELFSACIVTEMILLMWTEEIFDDLCAICSAAAQELIHLTAVMFPFFRTYFFLLLLLLQM